MSTKKLLNGFTKLRDELFEHGQSQLWVVQRTMLVTILKIYRALLKYQKDKIKYDLHVEIFESDRQLTEKDSNNIKEASAVNRQIGKHLSDLKKQK
jgi:hypothetical protein